MNILDILMERFFEILIFLDQVTGSLGLAIILFTFLLRSLMLPLTLPSLRARKKMQDLQPELKKLKKKHKNDKKSFQVAQMAMYKKYNVNPLSGCLPQIIQIAIIFFLYRAMIDFFGMTQANTIAVDPLFLWMNLGETDSTYILPVLAGVSQLVLSLMIAPGGEKPDVVPNQSKSKKIKKDNEKEEDMAEMAASMQKQMIFLMPVMTGYITTRFPSGLALYWVVTNIFSIGQQMVVSGPGGLVIYTQRFIIYTQRILDRLKGIIG